MINFGWKDKRVAVLGLGVEGMASTAFLRKKGAIVWILEQRQEKEVDQQFLAACKGIGVQFIFGPNYLDNLTMYDIIVRSPGIKLYQEKLTEAAKQNVVITSQTKLFFDYCPGQIIGVTGTKGKGTTSTLIYEMLKEAGKDVYLGGNVGFPPLAFLDKLTADSLVVLELSSFQLQDLHKSPHIAVMLMITSEHLDYHKDHEEYIAAKRKLVQFQTVDDYAIINRDYPASHESDIHTEAKVYQISLERETVDGCYKREDGIWIRQDGNEKKVIDRDKIKLIGEHNLENVCAAVMAATVIGIDREDIKAVLQTFVGLEHRLELVREVNNVKYFNDSFSTTPETAIAAIKAFKDPEILILGGSSKQSDFIELGIIIRNAKNIKAIIGVGEEWMRIKQELGIMNHESGILLIEGAKDMHTIVQAAVKIARPGDVILLSPACASFDMFRNYKERGEQFKSEVGKIESL